ncbi:MAG TPA: hypothetical protein DCM45_03730 [Clostridiales bacterium]|nr:hypothetical protein [Clostridiales bacterium]
MSVSKVPVAAGARNKSYYHFFEREMAEVPAEKLEFLKDPWQNDGNGQEIADINRIFDDGYLPGETGLFTLKQGGFLVTNLTRFEGSKGAMLQWFFGWHGLDPLRYSIWDPYDHYGLRISDEDRSYILDPGTDIPDKCRGVTHIVNESLIPGTEPAEITIHFENPAKMGLNTEKTMTPACSFLVTANADMGLPIVMLHTARDTEYGCELRSRFWIGYHIIQGVAQCLIPPEAHAQVKPLLSALLEHNFSEFTNLAAILPKLYAEEKNNWAD